MHSIVLTAQLDAVLADQSGVALLIGEAAAIELGLAALEHLEAAPSNADLDALASYAARHDERAPGRDALVAVLLDASGTLGFAVRDQARRAVMNAAWRPGRESAELASDPSLGAVPRRQSLAERLVAERARRIRPRVNALVTAIAARGAEAGEMPPCFVARSRLDVRDLLVQRVRHEPVHRATIARWLTAQALETRAELRAVEDWLVDVVSEAILQQPERAPTAPYLHDDRVLSRVASATALRGAPARARLRGYLARLEAGTSWHEAIGTVAAEPRDARAMAQHVS